jgi:predicted nucleic acid-binding protein
MMPKIDALLDSNVLIASIAEAHEHHIPSLNLLRHPSKTKFAVAAHSYAEAYSTLTRKGDRAPFHFSPADASAALESVRAVTILVGLTPAQTFDAVRSFAQDNGIGARLYDRLIGEVAVIHAIPQIFTWNIGHMASLFPTLRVVTPAQVPSSATGIGR